MVAALFAIHPLRAESVAWAAERKDVLSAVFWMLTLLSYAWYARRPHILRYLVVLVTLGLGVMSKSSVGHPPLCPGADGLLALAAVAGGG